MPSTATTYMYVALDYNLIIAHMTGCNVSSAGSKALGERPHHYVNIGRVYPPVLSHSTASPAHSTNAVSLIQVYIGLWVCVHGMVWVSECANCKQEREEGEGGRERES